jgi:hypothetical protein
MPVYHPNAVSARDIPRGVATPGAREGIRHGARAFTHPDGKRPFATTAIHATSQNPLMSALDHLKDFRIVLITLPFTNEEQSPTVECVARRRSVDTIEAAFPPGQLPVRDLDLNGVCRIYFNEGGRPFRLRSSIEEVLDGAKLRLKVADTTVPFSNREYFRVDANLTVKYQRLVEGEEAQPRSLSTRVNISGCGIRLPLEDPVRLNEKIVLTFVLSFDPLKEVRCIGEVKRFCPLSGGKKGAALHFVEIESADRDAIIAFCMAAQREELRTKIQTKDLG